MVSGVGVEKCSPLWFLIFFPLFQKILVLLFAHNEQICSDVLTFHRNIGSVEISVKIFVGHSVGQ